MRRLLQRLQIPVIFSLVSLTVAGSCQAATEVNGGTTTYQGSLENFASPERGFYANFLTKHQDSPLQAFQLKTVKAENISLVRRVYVIPQYRYNSLPQSFLEFVKQDFDRARDAGVKLVVRFAYNWDIGGYDAPKDIILTHLEQLQPILSNNYDVIAYLEAGFIGAWGQWNRSSHQLINNSTLDVTADSRSIFYKMLSALPPQRMVLLPFPKQKMDMFNTTQPLNSDEAFSGTYRARTGTHNDGFLASSDNLGFYTYRQVDRDKQYLGNDNLYVVHGGETASASEHAQPYIGCANALKEMAQLRWSVLNSEFHHAVLQRWEQQGCMLEIKRRLGYRFRLTNATIPAKVKPSGTFAMTFTVNNDGWASAYNPRKVEIVLRHKQTGKEYYLPVNEEPRKWMPGNSKTVNVEGGIPANMPHGKYQVFLNFPDPSPKLYRRPAYSIRLANQNTWEAATGYNSLLRSVTITPDVSGNNYFGNQVFAPR
ncbi:hypothetical protein BWI75_22540 [Gloeocapsopsis sp. AAB1 = 1H9]|uniref:DUF4832 domain-containing protein n=2 Tax=Gloeocapsopsis TaxID=693222 RepID=A0A6N8G3D9_9CHRO|nr:hypothetical protein [Gloeocapsopsis dulcis AAB1 = 1H9]